MYDLTNQQLNHSFYCIGQYIKSIFILFDFLNLLLKKNKLIYAQ